MATLNKVLLIGYLVADPELKQTQSGVNVCSFRIGVSRKFKNQDGTVQSDFIDIVTWRQQAEFVCKYFQKGRPILVVGSLQTRTWQDQQGNKRFSTEVVADEVSFVDSKSGGNGYSQSNPGYDAPPAGNNGYAPAYSQNQNSYTPPAYSSNPSQSSDNRFEEISGDDDLPF